MSWLASCGHHHVWPGPGTAEDWLPQQLVGQLDERRRRMLIPARLDREIDARLRRQNRRHRSNAL